MQRKTKQRTTVKDGTAVSKRRLGVGLAAVLVASGAFAIMPQPMFRTEAVVGVGDPTTPLREAMTEAAALTAVSKPVISRAASSLPGTVVEAPSPGLLDRLSVSLGLGHASGRDARLAETLTDAVTAKVGDAPGIVKILANASDAGAASQIATAVAEALIAEQDVEAVDLRHRHDVLVAREIEGLQTAALTAHRRFVALGGTDVDPGQARAAAAAQTAAAQARLDVVRTILASGSPPLSDRHDLPQTVASLQSAYLDLSQQLSKARETLGDRHTTVISLQDGMKRAGVELSAEWKRLSKVAESELAAARGRETTLSAAKAPVDAGKKAEQDEARRATLVADDALAQAERARGTAHVDSEAYSLVAPAPVPSQASGLSLSYRLLLSMFAGLMVLGMSRALASVSRALAAGERAVNPVAATMVEPKVAMPTMPVAADAPLEMRPSAPRAAARPEPTKESNKGAPKPKRHEPLQNEASQEADALTDRILADAMRDILPTLDAITPQGDLPVLLVGTNEAGSGTTSVTLALSTAAAEAGLRVLVVEASGAGLAAAVEADAEPALVDIFGSLRIALRADVEASDGMIYLAPTFRNNDRIVAGLARADNVPLVDDLTSEFDLVIIDGGHAAASVQLGACADAFLRVARNPSKRDDERFLATFDAPRTAFLGTITASTFVAKIPDGLRLVHPAPQPVARSGREPAFAPSIERRRVGAR